MKIPALILVHAATFAAAAAAEPAGLAASHPGDAGLAKHPAVLLFEDFEQGDKAALKTRWTEVSDEGGRVVSLEKGGPVAASTQCLKFTAHPREDTGGHLYQRLSRGVDKYFVRFYVKFSADPKAYVHHFFHLGGYRPATNWPQGGAGERPAGDDRITVGIEPAGDNGRQPAPGLWNFYPYWQEMKPSVGNKYWGNSIAPTTPLLVPREKWQCVEVMVALNSSPDAADGELALWLDGKEAMRVKKGTPRAEWSGMGFTLPGKGGEPFEGFRFRKSTELKLNFVWVMHYVTDTSLRRNGVMDFPSEVPVWFDNIVAATEYIGPIAPKD